MPWTARQIVPAHPKPCPPTPPCVQVGFLYLRYVCDPRKLWNWYHKYLRDSEVRTMQCWPEFCSRA